MVLPWSWGLAERDQKSVTTEELLKRYRDSDLAAFKTFYSRTKGLVFSYLVSRLRNQADAEEALQDTYFRVHRYILTYDPDKPAIPWLMTIARNSLINIVKKRTPVSSIDPDTIVVENGTAASFETRNLLEKVLAELKPDDRKFLEERIFSELSYEELARGYFLTPENARQKVSRMLRKVKTSFNS